MVTGLKRILQFVAILAVVACSIHAEERNSLTTLIGAAAQRLALAKEVALAKWDSGAPVEDPAREQQVIRATAAAGQQAGLPAEFVSRFFSAQMEANKLIQYALLTHWQGQGKAPRHARIDLAQNVRPEIDRIQAVLISALVNRPNSQSRASCRAQVAEGIKNRKSADPEISEGLLTVALERALGPLCDAAD
jgi:chorismate mutase